MASTVAFERVLPIGLRRGIPVLLALAVTSAWAASLAPLADHHAHLMSPAAARWSTAPLLPAVRLPEALARLLEAREKDWNDAAALERLYAEDAVILNTDDPSAASWIHGRRAVAEIAVGSWDVRYAITPVAYAVTGADARVEGYLTTRDGEPRRHVAHVFLALRRAGDAWRIAAEIITSPGPPTAGPITADELVAQLDDAGIRRAAVLSVAYWYGSAHRKPVADEIERVRAENDWTAAQAGRFPDRLVAFCSFNPLRDYALAELERCAKSGRFRGVKLHLGNSGVDVRKAADLQKLRGVFAAANARRMAIVLHMWTDPSYETEGKAHAERVLDDLLPLVPDVTVQIAHMAGGGRSTDAALGVFAGAIAAGDPRTRNLFFDVATLTAGQSAEGLRRDAERMRQIGLGRILYGTDKAPPQPPARASWAAFRALVPLTEEEFRTIAGNLAPYLRPAEDRP